MPVQDAIGTYTTAPDVGYAGMRADTALSDVVSKVVETAAIPFGRAVGAGTADGSVKLGGTGYIGIAIADKTRTADQYAVGEVAGIMRKGTVLVAVGADVADTDTVYFIPATGVITNASSGNTAIPNAKFETTTTSGNLARVYLG